MRVLFAVLAVAIVLYSVSTGGESRESVIKNAMEVPDAQEFIKSHPSSRPYFLSLAPTGFSNALSGMDAFFYIYKEDPLVLAAGNRTFPKTSALYVVSLSPNPPVKKAGWVAPHPDRPVLFLFFSGQEFLFAQENA